MAPLWHLCRRDNLDNVRAALARGEDVNSKDNKNATGLMIAVAHSNNSIVKFLLEQPTLDLNCTDSIGQTALHGAVFFENMEGLKMLLDDPRLTAVNHKNNDDETAVMFAMTNRRMDALRLLAFHPSVDLDARDWHGMSLEEVAR